MDQTVSQGFHATHPLAGFESWPTTGPVYGLADDQGPTRVSNLWERISARIHKSPKGDDFNAGQARIWY